jgi:Zn finger protein HypA/HybF involved in hydrogenase expression
LPRALIVEILGNAKQFGEELDRAAGKTRSMGKVAGVAGLALAGGLAYGLEKSVKAAMAAETSTARMDQAFKASGESAKRYSGQIDAAETSSRKLGFSNTDVRQSLGSLEIATKDPAKAFKDLGVAEDIARFKHVGLADASKVLTMAMSGSQRATKQLGLTIQPVTSTYDALKATMHGVETAQQKQELAAAKAIDKQKTAQEVIALVTEKLHGQAAAFAGTAAGGMAQFHAQTEALQENLGKTLLPAVEAVTTKLADLAGYLATHTTLAKALVIALAGVAVGLGVVKLATISWSETLLANPVFLVIAGLVALGVALYVAYQKSKTFRDIVNQAFSSIKAIAASVIDFLSQAWKKWGSDIVAVAHIYLGGLIAYFKTAWDIISGVFKIALDLIHGNWGKAWDDLKAMVHVVWDNIVNLFKTVLPLLGKLAADIGTGIYNGIIKPLAKLPGQLLNAIKDGINSALKTVAGWVVGAAEAIGKAILDGITHGITGLAGGLADKLKNEVGGAFSSAKHFLGIGSPSAKAAAEIGKPIADGIILGFLEGTANLPSKMSSVLRAALEQARKTVSQEVSKIGTEFGKIKSIADQALQAMFPTSAADTPAGKQLAALQAAHDAAAAAQTLADAKGAVVSAQAQGAKDLAAGADPQTMAADQKAIDDAIANVKQIEADQAYAAQVASLTALAQSQADANAKKEANEQQAMDRALAKLQAHLAKIGASHKDSQDAILKLLAGYGVGYESVGQDLGAQFAKGLKQGIKLVSKAAEELAKEIAKYLPHSPAEKGPLSKEPEWETFLLGGLPSATGRVGDIFGGIGGATMGASPGTAGGLHVHVHADTVIGGDMKQVAQDLSYPIRDALVRIGRREGDILGGFA